ncbi:MAG: hypothetical protein U5R31_14500 [Acidimicrobiia bacterium]|nr:hypothetical protein [Acidimicrobiia bacterium]
MTDRAAAPVRRSTVTSDESARRVSRLLALAVLVVPAVWGPLLVWWSDAPFALTFDDAYYYFGIARNVAEGAGSTFDGINPTNGYHPLWLGLSVPVYATGLDGLAAVRVLLGFQLAVWTATCLLWARFAATEIDGWPRLADGGVTSRHWCTGVVAAVLVVIAANPVVVRVFVNGLEAGIGALLLTGLLILVHRHLGRPLSSSTSASPTRLGLGAVVAATLLARTDLVLVAGCLGLWTLAEAAQLGRVAVRRLVESWAIPVVALGTYLVANWMAFGDPRQISGVVKQLPLTAGRLAALLVVVALALAVGRATWRRGERRTPIAGGSPGWGGSSPGRAGSSRRACSSSATTWCCRRSSGCGTSRPSCCTCSPWPSSGSRTWSRAAPSRSSEVPGARRAAWRRWPRSSWSRSWVSSCGRPVVFAAPRIPLDPDREPRRRGVDRREPPRGRRSGQLGRRCSRLLRRPPGREPRRRRQLLRVARGRPGTARVPSSSRMRVSDGSSTTTGSSTTAGPGVGGALAALVDAREEARLELVRRWPFRYTGRIEGEGSGSGARDMAVFLYRIEG